MAEVWFACLALYLKALTLELKVVDGKDRTCPGTWSESPVDPVRGAYVANRIQVSPQFPRSLVSKCPNFLNRMTIIPLCLS
jgi:hypothetical protein